MTLRELLSKIEDPDLVLIVDYINAEMPLVIIPGRPTRKDELTLAQTGAYLNREVERVQLAGQFGVGKKSYIRIRLERSTEEETK